MANINKLLRNWNSISVLTRDCLFATTSQGQYDKRITLSNFIIQFYDLIASADYNGSELENAIKDEVFSSLVKPGTVVLWPYTNTPNGYLEMDGSAINRSTYADLFSLLSTYYGNGDGFSTFNLPDVRGYFLRFRDAGSTRDPDRSSRTPAAGGLAGTVGSTQGDATKSPSGTNFTVSTDPDHSHGWGDYQTRWYRTTGSASDTFASDGDITTGTNKTLTTTNVSNHQHTVESSDDETRPDNVYITGLIKY